MSNIILCADDSKTMQTVAEITFRVSDYQYVGAYSADEALQKARDQKPVLILSDAIMPGKTGYDLCQMIKADAGLSGVPVIMLCGNSAPYDSAKGAEVGADGHLTKPWDTQVMLDKFKGAGSGKKAPADKPPMATPKPPILPNQPVGPGPTARAGTPPPSSPQAMNRSTSTIMGMPSVLPPAAAKEHGFPVPGKPAADESMPSLVDHVKPGTTGGRPAANDGTIRSATGKSPARAPESRKPTIPPPPKYGRPESQTVTTNPGLPDGPKPGPSPVPPMPMAQPGGAAISLASPVRSASPPASGPAPGLGPAGTPGIDRPPMIRGTATRRVTTRGVTAVSPAPPRQPAAASARLNTQVEASTSAAVADVARDAGLDPDGPEMRALLALSKDVVERVVWEVVPDLAETIIRENLDQLVKR